MRTYTVNYTVILATDDDNTSLNQACDAVSSAVWNICEEEGYNFTTNTTILVYAEEEAS